MDQTPTPRPAAGHPRAVTAISSGPSQSLTLTGARSIALGIGRVVVELALLYAVFQAYSYLRKTFFQQPAERAYAHALEIIDIQAAIGLSVGRIELALQRRVLEQRWLVDLFNAYYREMKTVIFISAALAVLLAPAAAYRRVWRIFMLATLAAVPWYAIYPLAPPRFMDEYGYPFVDTLAVFGGTISSATGLGGANQFAAMPSMHIGWTVVAAMWLAAALPRWRLGAILGSLHVLLMSLTVMATGNHYSLDVAGGLAVVAVAYLLERRWSRRLGKTH